MRAGWALVFAVWACGAGAVMPHMEEFERKLSLGLGIQAQDYGFELSGGTGLSYKPNITALTMFSVNYAGIGGISYGIHQKAAGDAATKGDTRFEDWRFNFPYRQFSVFVFYSRFSGFYLADSGAIDNTLTSEHPYILFPDMYAQNMGGSFTWVWKPERFSLAAMMDMTERQVKSGGSFLLGAAATETIFRNSGAIIPLQVKNTYENDAEMYEGRVRAFSVKAGWGYTEVYRRRWFTSLMASLGVGPQEVRISTSSEDYSIQRLGMNFAEVYGILGFNGDTFFSGISGFTAISNYQAQKAQISTRIVNAGVFLGTRF